MRILVTGALGCIGSWVTKSLLDRGLDPVLYDADSSLARLSLLVPSEDLKRVTLEVGVIEDTDRIKRLVREAGITHIVHLAARLMPFCNAYPALGGLANVGGTLNVFEAARDAGRPVGIVYASSSTVYSATASDDGRSLTENDAANPDTLYGAFKRSNEITAHACYRSYGVSSIGLRPGVIYGVGRDSGISAGPSIAMKAIAFDRPYVVRFSGPVDLHFVEDVADAFVRSLLLPQEGAHVFNLSGRATRVQDLLSLLARLRPRSSKLLRSEGPQLPVSHCLDDSRLRSIIPEITHTSLEDGIEKTITAFERLQDEGRLKWPLSEEAA
jgi:nucleoside-diphosphate-sugar epimerase